MNTNPVDELITEVQDWLTETSSRNLFSADQIMNRLLDIQQICYRVQLDPEVETEAEQELASV